jgi:hypothetical protein
VSLHLHPYEVLSGRDVRQANRRRPDRSVVDEHPRACRARINLEDA